MAITTKTALWKLAAIRLGMAPSVHILNASSPSTALELTFDQLYDSIRVEMLRSGKFDFANRTRELRAAPTIDSNGNTHNWNDPAWNARWDYVYAPPTNMLQFLNFMDEPPALGYGSDYEMLPLPIQYTTRDATVQVLTVISPLDSTNWLPSYVWRDWARGVFYDNSNVKHTIKDKADGPTVDGFDWIDVDDGVTLTGHASQTYTGGMTWSVDFNAGIVAGIYDLTAAVALTVEFAYGLPDYYTNTQTWREHIATNKANAVARYVADVTDVSIMPVEFQTALALEMAYQASMVHAKSPRVIQQLGVESARAQSKAISSLSSDDVSIEGGGPARATRARY